VVHLLEMDVAATIGGDHKRLAATGADGAMENMGDATQLRDVRLTRESRDT